MKPKGILRTHGDLARLGLLPSLAKNLHLLDISKIKVAKAIGPTVTVTAEDSEFTDQEMGEKIKERQIAAIQDMLAEFRQAIADGISVSVNELKRLENRLSWLRRGAN